MPANSDLTIRPLSICMHAMLSTPPLRLQISAVEPCEFDSICPTVTLFHSIALRAGKAHCAGETHRQGLLGNLAKIHHLARTRNP